MNAPVEDLDGLRDDGYDAVLVATGTPLSTRMGVPGDQLDGVLSGVAFLRAVKLGEGVDLKRSTRRRHRRRQRRDGHGPDRPPARRADVTVVYRRTRAEMPAHHVEADDTEKEGVGFIFQAAPVAVLDDGHGATRGLRCSRMAPGAPDASGRSRPEPVPGSEFDIDCDVIITRDRHGAGHRGVRRPGPGRRRTGRSWSTSGRSRPTCRGCSPPATS